MKNKLVSAVFIVTAVLSNVVLAAGCGTLFASMKYLNTQHGSGTINIMAVRPNGTPAVGRTVITITDPCFNTTLVDDEIVDFNIIEPGQTSEGRLFDFIVPNSECHGKYFIYITVDDNNCVSTKVLTFKL